MHPCHAISPGFSGHYQDLELDKHERIILVAYKCILSVGCDSEVPEQLNAFNRHPSSALPQGYNTDKRMEQACKHSRHAVLCQGLAHQHYGIRL